MRWGAGPMVMVLIAGAVLSGCLDGGGRDVQQDPQGLDSLEVYEYRYPGDAVMHAGYPYGWMARVTNDGDEPALFTVQAHDNDTEWGPVTSGGWQPENGTEAQALDAGQSLLFLFQRPAAPFVPSLEYTVSVVDSTERASFNRTLTQPLREAGVNANDQVTTATVGVWTNGTSFYTNIRGLNEDPGFPAGYDRENFGGSDLRVYVYDEDTSEQPAGSRDRCFSVTIPGYNDLLKSQAEGTSNVRFLAPEEAYTREGREDHDLYGDALVFMNTIVAHGGEVTPLQELPQPTGDCFDPQNTVPLPEGPV